MSNERIPNWQHVVNGEVRQVRSPAGDMFTSLVVEVAQLGGMFSGFGEGFAKVGGQTLAHWVVLDAVEDGPATVADIARRRGMARQGVQRVADLLVRDGLAVYEPNPRHRRAKLLRPTDAGRAVLGPISRAQAAWADAVGGRIGEDELARTREALERIRAIVVEEAGRERGD